jgi:hypothetical protein
MAVVARLEAILSANTAQFDSAMTRSEGRMQKVGHVAGIAGLAIAGGLAYGLEKSVKAAMGAETSTARLEAAFKASGESAKRYSGQIDTAEASGRKLGFMNTDLRDSLGSLEVATHNHTKAIHLMGVAEDIARFKHVDLASASKMLSMAMAGSQRAVKQLGITVPAVTTHYDALKRSGVDLTTVLGRQREAHAKLQDKMATSAAVIAAVTDKTKGQAKAFADTAAGGMEKFHAQLEALQENLGKALLPAIVAVTTKLSDLLGFLAKHTTVTKILVIALAGFALALMALSVAGTIAAASMSAFWIAATAGIALLIPVLIAITYEVIKHWDKIKDIFFTALDAIKGALSAALDWIKAHWTLIAGILLGPIGFAVAEIIKHRDTLIRIFTQLPGQIAGAFRSGYETVKNAFTELGGWIVDFFKSLPGRMADAFKAEWKMVKDAVTGLFGKVIDWVKGALGISSPSTVFYKIGQHSIQGFIDGVGSMAGVLEHAVVGMAKDALSHLNPFQGGSSGSGQQVGTGLPVRGGPAPASSFEGFGHLMPQVVEALHFARQSGWHGRVTSGYRSYAEQKALYERYLHGGPLAAKPGTSSHERGAAVDVTDYGAFGRIMRHAPAFERLYNRLGRADPVHYSISGYDKGGWLPTGVSLAVNNTGSPERVVGPGGGGDTVIVQVGPEEVARVVFDQMRGKAQVYSRRNGRLAFGGA